MAIESADNTTEIVETETPEIEEVKVDLGDLDDNKEDVDDPDDSEEDSDDADKEDEPEEDDDADEEPEIVVTGRFADVKTKYPNIVKEFPWLKNVVYKEKAYAEILPTIDDAKEAAEASRILSVFEADLVDGNTEKLLAGVKRTDSEAFNKVVDNYLTVLKNVDPNAHQHVITNILREAVGVMVIDARENSDDDLLKIAAEMNKYFFNTTKLERPTRLGKAANPDEDKLKNDREAFHREKFETNKSEVMSRVDNRLKSTIEANIDPKEVMSPYVKNKAIEDAVNDLQSRKKNDSRFNNVVNKLWESARKSNYSKDSIEAIRKAHLHFATTHLGNVIGKARGQALRTPKTAKKDNNRRDVTPIRRSASSDNKSGDNSQKQDKWQGLSTREILDLSLGKL